MANSIRDLRMSIYINNDKAKASLIELSGSMKKLGDEMAELESQHKKDTPLYREKKKAYEQMGQSMDAATKQAGLMGMSMKDLSRLASSLRNSLKRAIPDSPEAKEYAADLAVVAKRQKELEGVLKASSLGLGNMKGGLNNLLVSMSGAPGIIGMVGTSLIAFGATIKTFLLNPVVLAASAIVGLFTGMFSLVKHSMAFSKALSELSALTGATGKDLDYLKTRAKDLGAQYGMSAEEIVVSMKKVGSAKAELLENVTALSAVTAAVIKLSKATSDDLGETTTSVTTIMNQFGFSASEAERVVNVLAAGSKYGAGEVDYLGESISKVGAIAKNANISLEATTAVMELFAEKGIRAETAGRGFKNILVDLQKDTKNYKNGVFDLNLAIENNQKIAGDNIALQKKFGQEFFNLAQILFQNKERFDELTKSVTGTNVAEEQMSIATDNLSGDMNKMKATWDAFILALEDGNGPIANTFRKLIQWVTKSVSVLRSLTKSGAQKEADATANSASTRVDDFKKRMSTTDPQADINAEIKAEQSLYQTKKKKIEQNKEQIAQNIRLGGAWKKNNKELLAENKGLQSSVNNSIAYVNALAGLRQEMKTTISLAEDKLEDDTSVNGSGSKSSKNVKKIWDEQIKAAEENAKQQEVIYLQMLKNKLVNEEQYNVMSEMLALDLLRKKKSILEDHKQDTIDIQKQILEAEIKQGDLSGKINQGNIPTLDVAGVDMDEVSKGLSLYMDYLQKKKDADIEYDDWKKDRQQKNIEALNQAADVTVAIAEGAANAVMSLHQMEADDLEIQKQKELAAAGNNADAREEIEKKYAKKEFELKKKQANSDMAIKIAQAIANGFQAIASIWAVHAANPILAAALSIPAAATVAFQVAAIKKQRDVIMASTFDGDVTEASPTASRVANSQITTSQAAEGRWDVVGADDRRTYRNVPYRGIARTGIVSRPTLMGERGDELIIDNPTLRNIRMNAPGLISEVMRMRVRQRASGKWNTDTASNDGGLYGSIIQLVLDENTKTMQEVSSLLRWLKENRIEAYTVLSDFEKKRDLRDKSVRKGSL